MKFANISIGAATTALALALGGAGWAQDANSLTAEELIEKFAKQKTRGLVLVPTTPEPAAPETQTETVATTVQPAPEPVTETAAVVPETQTEEAVTPATYQPVAKEDQINVQISFDFDSASLRNDQKPMLTTMCSVMKSVDVSVFQIIGHTDSSGSAAYNENLSLLRAQEVKRFLVEDCGMSTDRLQAIGMGESSPFNESNPRADENRRVEFQALG